MRRQAETHGNSSKTTGKPRARRAKTKASSLSLGRERSKAVRASARRTCRPREPKPTPPRPTCLTAARTETERRAGATWRLRFLRGRLGEKVESIDRRFFFDVYERAARRTSGLAAASVDQICISSLAQAALSRAQYSAQAAHRAHGRASPEGGRHGSLLGEADAGRRGEVYQKKTCEEESKRRERERAKEKERKKISRLR